MKKRGPISGLSKKRELMNGLTKKRQPVNEPMGAPMREPMIEPVSAPTKKQYSPFTIAAVYIGTVVGAGFASGQEVLQFFGYFGIRGFIGIIISTALFMFFGYLILKLGYRLKAQSFLPVIISVAGQKIGLLIDIIITFFMFGVVVTMAAGAGAIFVEQFNLPALWGGIFMIAISLVTVLLGVNRVIESISFVAPILVASILGLALWTILSFPQGLSQNINMYDPVGAAVPFWPLAALLYSSYNLVLAIPVLAPLGALSDPKALRSGAIWGGIGLGVCALAISASILTRAPEATRFEVPMIAIAGSISPLIRTLYSFVLVAEVYTTAVAGLYGFASRLTKEGTASYRWLAVGAAGLSLILAQFGFSNLVSYLFPAEGFAGFLMLGALGYCYIKACHLPMENIAPSPALKPDTENGPSTGSRTQSNKQPGVCAQLCKEEEPSSE